jgi:hypothetical protein
MRRSSAIGDTPASTKAAILRRIRAAARRTLRSRARTSPFARPIAPPPTKTPGDRPRSTRVTRARYALRHPTRSASFGQPRSAESSRGGMGNAPRKSPPGLNEKERADETVQHQRRVLPCRARRRRFSARDGVDQLHRERDDDQHTNARGHAAAPEDAATAAQHPPPAVTEASASGRQPRARTESAGVSPATRMRHSAPNGERQERHDRPAHERHTGESRPSRGSR